MLGRLPAYLPARQRAGLILRAVLDFPAAEVAGKPVLAVREHQPERKAGAGDPRSARESIDGQKSMG